MLSQATRFVVGARGQLGGWDAETALVRAENQVEDRIVSGYFLYNEFLSAVRGGRINPFAPNDASGLAVIEGLKVADTTRNSKGTTTSWDFKLSSELAELDGGALTLAFGGEARVESPGAVHALGRCCAPTTSTATAAAAATCPRPATATTRWPASSPR